MAQLEQLLKYMVEQGASDLHISVGAPPMLRIDGSLNPLKAAPLTPGQAQALCYSILSQEQIARYEATMELDFSFAVAGVSRFRGNIFRQRGGVAGAFRAIPIRISTFDELALPPVIGKLTDRPRGLILVTGPTGSGKSTTLAAILDKVNREKREHIITIEDPIEFVYSNINCLVNQREIGPDTGSFVDALKYVLRQDPDVVLIGELRDLETIQAAMTISETGHLAFGTLHTNGCVQTINRIVDVFPPHQQPQVRAQLSFVLEAIISQQLLPRAKGRGRVPAIEIMIPTPAIRNLIREDKAHQIYSTMQVGQTSSGMQTMNQSLFRLFQQGEITLEVAYNRSSDPDELQNMIEQQGGRGGRTTGRR